MAFELIQLRRHCEGPLGPVAIQSGAS